MKKRGQVTVFIIVGIVLLISIGLVFVFRNELISDTQISYPAEVEPVAFTVRDCLQQKANEGLSLLGAQGGYIYIPSQVLDDPNLYVDLGAKIPYWRRGDRVSIPSIERMSFDLSKYIEENLRDCVGDFSNFKDYEISETGDLSVNTTIGDNAIVFSMNYPLNIKLFSDASEYDVVDFGYSSNIKLKKLWELSREIMNNEIRTQKIEDTTFDLIAMDDKIPVTGYDFVCNKKEWKIKDIEDRLKLLLLFNLPFLRIEKTGVEDFPDEYDYMNSHYIWDATQFEYDDVSVNFGLLENEPFTMYVSPNKGEYLYSSVVDNLDKKDTKEIGIDVTPLLSLMCFQIWKFNYDVTYSAYANVLDETTGYKLTFPFDVGIDNNEPASTESIEVEYENYVERGTNEDYCNARENDIAIHTNEYTNNDNFGGDLGGVLIDFDCMQYTCELGISAPEGLKTKIPYCTYGIMRAEKEGYISGEAVVEIGQDDVSIDLVPLHKINNFVVKKYVWNENVNDWYVDNVAQSEYALISLRGELNVNNKSIELTSTATYPSESNVQDYVEVFEGSDVSYFIDINLIRGGSIVGSYSGEWDVNWQDILLSNEIMLPVIVDSENPIILGLNASLIPEIEIR